MALRDDFLSSFLFLSLSLPNFLLQLQKAQPGRGSLLQRLCAPELERLGGLDRTKEVEFVSIAVAVPLLPPPPPPRLLARPPHRGQQQLQVHHCELAGLLRTESREHERELGRGAG